MAIHLRVYLLDDRPSHTTLDFRGVDSALLAREWLELLERKKRERGREPSLEEKRVADNHHGSLPFPRKELPRDITILSADGSRRIGLRKGGQMLSTCSLTMGLLLGRLQLFDDSKKNAEITFCEVWVAFNSATIASASKTCDHTSNEEGSKTSESSSTNPRNTPYTCSIHPKRKVRVGLEAPLLSYSPDDAYITRPRLDYMNKEINLLQMHATKIDHSLACTHGSDSKRSTFQLPHPNMPFVTRQIAAAVASPKTKCHFYSTSTEQLLSLSTRGKERTGVEGSSHHTKAPKTGATFREAEDVLIIVEDEEEEELCHQSHSYGSKVATAREPAADNTNEPYKGAARGANGVQPKWFERDMIEGNTHLQKRKEESQTVLSHVTYGTAANLDRRVANEEPTEGRGSRQSSHNRSVVHLGEKKSSSRSVSETSDDCRLLLRREYSPPIGSSSVHNPLMNFYGSLASSFQEKTSCRPSAPRIEVGQEAFRNEISSPTAAASVSARIFLEMCRVRARCSVSATNHTLEDTSPSGAEEQGKLRVLIESFLEQSLSQGRSGYDGERTSAGGDVVVVHSEMIEVCLPNDGETYTVGELKDFLLKNVLPPTYALPHSNGRSGSGVRQDDLLRKRVILKHGRRLLSDENESVEGLLQLSTGRQETNTSDGLDDGLARNVTVLLSCRYLL